jgi:hypothetical protein
LDKTFVQPEDNFLANFGMVEGIYEWVNARGSLGEQGW